MPAPKITPEQREDIARRYMAGDTLDTLAEVFGVCKTTIARQLEKAGVSRRAFSPYTEKRIECPYTADRLREMYWREAMSISEIGQHAAILLERDSPVFQKTILRWFAECGIAVRSLTEAHRVRVRMHPGSVVPGVAAMKATPRRPPVQPITKRIQRMGRIAAAKLKRRTETRPCAWCAKPITRRPSEFRFPPEQTCCGKYCVNKLRWYKQKTAQNSIQSAAARNPELAKLLNIPTGDKP